MYALREVALAKEGVAEAQKCATACDFYAENAARFLEREPIATEARLALEEIATFAASPSGRPSAPACRPSPLGT